MISKRIPGATRYLGAPSGWDPERDGPCGHLAIRDDPGPYMVSRWEPTPDELRLLNQGGSVELTVVGGVHPPVALIVVPQDKV